MKIRQPSQAGAFYQGSANTLRQQLEWCFKHKFGPGKLPEVKNGPKKILALVCPHAGYMYSGPVAAHSYYNLALDGKPDIIVILGPNHTGMGSGVSLMSEGAWNMPLGNVNVNSEIADKIWKASKIIDLDDEAHLYEHSIEVQLPFLQYIYGSDFKFVPIAMLMQDLQTSRMVGNAIAEVLSGKNAVIIASSDMTHYEPQEYAEKKDKMVADTILNLDEEKLQSTVDSQGITMCGPGPVTAAITAAKKLGATKAKMLCYKTSGDITGDYSRVVGYLAAAISRT
ncbi:MAG TPA: AmmeMemoRadiSam system protein B [archaeon]|nr:AmmeMemoRadiSam system protein B [archaeon]